MTAALCVRQWLALPAPCRRDWPGDRSRGQLHQHHRCLHSAAYHTDGPYPCRCRCGATTMREDTQ